MAIFRTGDPPPNDQSAMRRPHIVPHVFRDHGSFQAARYIITALPADYSCGIWEDVRLATRVRPGLGEGLPWSHRPHRAVPPNRCLLGQTSCRHLQMTWARGHGRGSERSVQFEAYKTTWIDKAAIRREAQIGWVVYRN